MRRLRERLRLITPHWPWYPGALGFIAGDFNICEPEGGRFNDWNQTFTNGDAGRLFFSQYFFPHVLEIAQLTLREKIQQPMVQYARCPGLTGHSSISLWLKHAISIAILMYLRTLTCARSAGTHGDVLNVHTEGRGSSLVLLTKICPRMVIT